MLQVDFYQGKGWARPRLAPYQPLRVETSASCLHYGLTCFEDLLLLRNPHSKSLAAFRPEQVLGSFLDASEYLDMPPFNPDQLFAGLKELVVKSDEKRDLDARIRMVHLSTYGVLGIKTT